MPEATATVADLISANSKLGWRDVQNIMALTAKDTATRAFTTATTGNMAFGWTVNGANNVSGGGGHFSDDVGFADIVELVREYGRYGYRKIAVLLRDGGWLVNDKRVERI